MDPKATESQQTPAEAPSLDITAAVDDIAESLNLSPKPAEAPTEEGAPEGEQQPAAVAAPAPPAEPAAPAAEVKPAEPEAPAPHTWRPEAKAAWAQVPPVVREEMAKRERDIQSYVDQNKTPIAVGNQFQKIVEPFLADFAKANINVFENYAATLQVQKALAYGSPQEKMQVLQQLAQSAGIDLQGTALSAPEGAAQQHVARLEARIAQLEAGVGSVTSTVRDAQVEELSAVVVKFAEDKENHPFAEELLPDMNALIQKGLARTLEEAYQQAVIASPTHRQKAFDAEVEKRSKAAADAEAARTASAQTAAAANVRSNGSRRTPQPVASIDDTLKEALANINSRTH